MSSTVAKTWKMIKPHVPLIHFKKGGRLGNATANVASGKPSPAAAAPSPFASIQRSSVSEANLPGRYSRKQITQAEMETIELGGVRIL
ncbi:ribosomal protein S36 [Tyrophagus putrescentiae]|nr:ribosomal protein S36 [Tyrophagus putrescentiae]